MPKGNIKAKYVQPFSGQQALKGKENKYYANHRFQRKKSHL